MHRIVQAHLREFCESRGFSNLDPAKQFEEFATYCVAIAYVPGEIDPEPLTTGDGDTGIDGLAVIIDEELVRNSEAAEEAFTGDRRNHDVRFVAVQAKSGEKFDKGDILKFTSAVENLFIDDSTSTDELEQETARILETVIANANKVRGGKPAITCRFVTTGQYTQPVELEKVFESLRSKLIGCGVFADVNVGATGRDELLKAWQESITEASAQITLHSVAPLPKISNIEESYLAVVRAQEFVQCLLIDDVGKLRTFVFNENVRAFLGAENPVNDEIRKTIKNPDKSAMFPVLNNGITVISPNVVLQGTTATLSGFQIVNGCQTSNVLYMERNSLPSDMMVNLKIVETSNTDVISDLVRATNSQSAIDREQFYSLKPISKAIEEYFNSFEDGSGRIYFERRERQYHGSSIPAIRIFNLTAVAKGVTAMFLERPELSYQYAKRMFEIFGDKIFDTKNREIIYYTACLVLYRLHLLVGSAAIPQNSRKVKWHLLTIVRVLIAGTDLPPLTSPKIEAYCSKIVKVFSASGDEPTRVLNKALAILKNHIKLSDEALKRATIGSELSKKGASASL